MTFRFKKQSNGSIYAFNERSTTRLATYRQDDAGEWECIPNEKVEFAEGVAAAMDAAFADYIEVREETPEPEPEPAAAPAPPIPRSPSPRPPLDPISGTTGLAYMAWAAEHMEDEEFRETYGDRIAHKPTFLPYVKRTPGLEAFTARAEALISH